jgi:hypothetical protein
MAVWVVRKSVYFTVGSFSMGDEPLTFGCLYKLQGALLAYFYR